MRQISKIFALAMAILIISTNSWAGMVFSWDLSQLGLTSIVSGSQNDIISGNYLSLDSGGVYGDATIKQEVDADGNFFNGATFTEFGMLGVTSISGLTTSFYEPPLVLPFTEAHIYFSFSGLSGSISNVAGPSFDITFDAGVGDIFLQYAVGNVLDPDNDTKLAAFKILDAGSTDFIATSGALNSGFSFVYGMTEVFEDGKNFWKFGELFVEDYLDLYGPNTVLGFAELNAEILGIDEDPYQEDNKFYKNISVANAGTTDFVVPEPNTLLLLGAGLLGLGAVARRRKN